MPDRYWVGGTANWDGTAGSKWSATSGGAGGASLPTIADNVFINAKPAPTWQASTAYVLTNIVSPVTGNGFFYECTTAGTTAASEPTWPTVVGNTVTDGTAVWTCRASTITVSAGNTGGREINFTGFTGTLTGTAAFTVANLILNASMTYSYTGTLTFNPNEGVSSRTWTLTTAGKTLSNLTLTYASSGVQTWLLGDALTVSGQLTHNRSTFDTSVNNYSVTAGSIVAGDAAAIKRFFYNGSTVTVTTFNLNTSNVQVTAGTSNIVLIGAASFNVPAVTFSTVSVGANATSATFATGFTAANFTLVCPTTARLTTVTLAGNITLSGTLSFTNTTTPTSRVFLCSDTIATARSISAATLSGSDGDIRDITLTGVAAGSTLTRGGNCGGNTGITFPASKTVYRVGSNTSWAGSNSWATSSGGTGNDSNFPVAQDTAVFDENSNTASFTLSTYNISALDCSNRTTAVQLVYDTPNPTFYGSHTYGAGVTTSGSGTAVFSGRGTMTFTSAGKTLSVPTTIIAPGGTFQLGDASIFSAITLTRGTLNANNYNLTCTAFDSNNTNTRTITMGSGLWTLTSTGAIWNTATTTNLTFNKDTANITLSDNSTSTRSFNGGGLTFNNLTIGGASSTSTLEIGNATFGNFATTKTVAHTISLTGNLTVSAWLITGSAGNIVTLNSSVLGTPQILSKSSAGYLTGISHLSIRDVVASPAGIWYVGASSSYVTTPPNTGSGFLLCQYVDTAVVVLTSTSSTTWTVPADWNNANNTIHLIGGGGGGAGGFTSPRGGGGGGGGGGYTVLVNQTLTPGSAITYQAGAAGAGGNGSNQNGSAGGTTSWNSGAATAGGGGGATASTAGTAGVGSTNNGGAGGNGSAGTNSRGGGGGGGAGGPNGVGRNGGVGSTNFPSTAGGGGGGGNGGGSNGGNASGATNGAGGNNSSGVGGGPANISGAVGGGGAGRTSVLSSTLGGAGLEIFGVGSGGGGGGGFAPVVVQGGGLYGGGGGGGFATGQRGTSGAQGAIIIRYVPIAPPPSTATGDMFFMFN